MILGNNKITDLGIINLIPSLSKHLKYIDLSGNNFGAMGCQYIASVIEKRSCE